MKYEKPILERLGWFRNNTLNGGCQEFGDGATPFHRYACTK